ncbi:MAG: hypothetical protein B6I31_01650 [Desulfobacteraceae bacterium 4572_19]|nr:MAG: hypothetical protein B6I31_01650 [Desulfobacteraceae bacterium 4572_19]
MFDTNIYTLLMQDVSNHLKILSDMGCDDLDCDAENLARLNRWGSYDFKAKETLETILNELGECSRCILCKSRKTIVFGSGNPSASVVFIGDFPGHDEDLSGQPFAGDSGELFTKILQAMNLARDNVYLSNILKCMPADNHKVTSIEINTCLPFLKRQLDIINPKIICTLGTIATQSILGLNKTIDSLRGRFYDYNGIMLMPTYHPLFILRNPVYKRQVWNDMQMIMKQL